MYCLDTYALWEIQLGNKKYVEILLSDFVVTDWTLCEFYKTLLKAYNERTADFWFKKIKPYVCKVDIDVMIESVKFQKSNIKKKLSLFDCIGYIFSISKGYDFVTGDKEFKKMKDVKFLK